MLIEIAKAVVITAVLVLFESSAFAADCTGGARYKDNGNGTVTDCKSGLLWLKDANCRDTSGGVRNPDGLLYWGFARAWSAGLKNGLCGLKDGSSDGDWRLPTKDEWVAMVADAMGKGYYQPALSNAAGSAQWTNGDVFYNVQSSGYWSSTTHTTETDFIFIINMYKGYVHHHPQMSNNYIWPVRDGKPSSTKTQSQTNKLRQSFDSAVSVLRDCEYGALGGLWWPTSQCNTVREKVVRIAQQMSPPPSVPEAARRHIVRSMESVRAASSGNDYSRAESEFRGAINEAPWLGVAYLNHAIVDIRNAELTETQLPGSTNIMMHYGRALHFLKLYLLTGLSPDDEAKTREMIYKVEFRLEKLR